MALVVVDWGGRSMSVTAGSTGSLGCSSGGGGGSWRPGSVGATTSAEKTGLEARTSSRPRSAGGAGSGLSAVGAAERHD